MRDIKELIGALMCVTGGGEIAEAEITDLAFDADGELLAALNTAYIGLLEFVHDQGVRGADPDLDRKSRGELKELLDRIVVLCDPAAP
jgi:hypothetical protein